GGGERRGRGARRRRRQPGGGREILVRGREEREAVAHRRVVEQRAIGDVGLATRRSVREGVDPPADQPDVVVQQRLARDGDDTRTSATSTSGSCSRRVASWRS